MKIFVAVLVLGAGLFYWQQHHSATSSSDAAEKNSTVPTASITPRPVYEHDWAKHSLDRAHAVTDQVAKGRKENGQP